MLLIRRVTGLSMLPTLEPGKIIMARRSTQVKVGDIVIIRHQGLEKIKRIAKLKTSQVFVVGDNPNSSTDSKDFGWISDSCVVAKLIWHS